MTPPILTSLKTPLAIRPEYVASHPITLRLKQSNKSWSRGDFTIYYEDESSSEDRDRETSNGPSSSRSDQQQHSTGIEDEHENSSKASVLFSVKGKTLSLKRQRTFFDASGLPLFDVYQKSLSMDWVVQLPGDTSDKSLARLSLATSGFALKRVMDLTVYVSDNKTVNLRVQEEDIWKLRTNVFLGSRVVMTAKRTDKLTPYIPGKGFEWIIDVAEGVDTSLSTVIMVVLATTIYDGGSIGAGVGAGAGAAAGASC